MKLSAPIFLLKRNARLLSRQEKIPLHDALDRTARSEGSESWSLLAAKAAMDGPAGKLFSQLQPGDLVLIAARPSQSKTSLGIDRTIH